MPRGLYRLTVALILELRPTSLIVISPFLDENSASFIKSLAEAKVEWVAVYTRAPRKPTKSHSRAVRKLCRLRRPGFTLALDYEEILHKKVIYINGKIKITGSLNFASWSDRNEEEIQIFADPTIIENVIKALSEIGGKGLVSVTYSEHVLGDLVEDLHEIIESIKAHGGGC